MRKRSERLPSYQRIADYAITHERLARTCLGKLQRYHLAERYEQAKQGKERNRAWPSRTLRLKTLIKLPPRMIWMARSLSACSS